MVEAVYGVWGVPDSRRLDFSRRADQEPRRKCCAWTRPLHRQSRPDEPHAPTRSTLAGTVLRHDERRDRLVPSRPSEGATSQIGSPITGWTLTETAVRESSGHRRASRGQQRALGIAAGPGRQPLVHRIARPTRSGGSRRPASSPSSRSPPPAATLRHRGRPGRQPLVHRRRCATRSGGSRRPASSPSSPSPRPAAALRHRGRPGRQPLVHRIQLPSKIGRITTAGVITEFPIPTAGSGPVGIAAGPDGNLWFTEYHAGTDRPDHDGRRRRPSSRSCNRQRDPGGIAAGPDGNLWFTEFVANKIGRITHGRRHHRVPDPHGQQQPVSASRPARTATSGSPTYVSRNQIGRITTAPTTPAAHGCRRPCRHRQQLQRQRCARAGRDRPGRPVLEEHSDRSRRSLTGTASEPHRSRGPTYTIDDSSADYGTISAGDDRGLRRRDRRLLPDDRLRSPVPAAHWDATFTEDLSSNSIPQGWTLHVGSSFPDVPTRIFYRFIENLFHNGVTGGCARRQLLPGELRDARPDGGLPSEGKHGSSHVPPPCTGTVFPTSVEPLRRLDRAAGGSSITAGCGGGIYCPDNPVTRPQMAVFLLKAEHGAGYAPPGVRPGSSETCLPERRLRAWIEQLYNRKDHRRLRPFRSCTAPTTQTRAGRWPSSSSRRSDCAFTARRRAPTERRRR